MDCNYLEIPDMVVNDKKASFSKNMVSNKKKYKNSLFSNVLNNTRNNKNQNSIEYENNENNINNANKKCSGNNNDESNVEIQKYSKLEKISDHANEDTKNIDEISCLDTDKLEASLPILNMLNELVTVLLSDIGFDIENLNVKDISNINDINDITDIIDINNITDNKVKDLKKVIDNLVNYIEKAPNSFIKAQLIEIEELSSDLMKCINHTENANLAEVVEKLSFLVKAIEKKWSQHNIENGNNSETFVENKSTSYNNVSKNQDKVFGEFIVRANNTDKIGKKSENKLESNINKENTKSTNEFKLFYNLYDDSKVNNINESNRFVHKIDFNQYKTDNHNIDNLLKEIGQKAKFILKKNGSEIKIQLKPEILGKMVLKMAVEEGEMHAKALVDNTQAKQLIDSNITQLKETLKDQGIEVKTFEVFVGKDSNFDSQEKRYRNGKSNIKLKKVNIDEYDDVSACYLNTLDNTSNTMMVYTSNFDIKA